MENDNEIYKKVISKEIETQVWEALSRYEIKEHIKIQVEEAISEELKKRVKAIHKKKGFILKLFWWARKYYIEVVIIIAALLLLWHFKSISLPTGQNGIYDVKSDILSILSILFAFLAIVGTGIYFWISRNITEEVKILMRNERNACRADGYKALSYAFSKIYYRDKIKFSGFLDYALEFDEKALEMIDGLGMKEYGTTVLDVKNNLAYSLADKQTEDKTINQKNKERALKIKNELWEMIISGEANECCDEVFSIEETCSWVIYSFAENQAEKENARQIILNLERRYPTERYSKLKERYGLN